MSEAYLLRLRTNPIFQDEVWDPVAGMSSKNIDDTSEWLAMTFQAPQEDLISHVGFRINSVTGTPPTYRVSLRNLELSGRPSDSVITSVSFTPEPSWVNTFQWFQLLTPYIVTRGQKLCIVIDYLSGAVSTSNTIKVTPGFYGGTTLCRHLYPYWMHNASGSISRGVGLPIFGLKSYTRVYGNPFNNLTYTQKSTPGQAGLRMRFDPGWGTSCKLRGAQVQFNRAASAGSKTCDLVVYDNGGELTRVTYPCDITKNPTEPVVARIIFPAPDIDIEFGKEYFLVISPNEADTGSRLQSLEVENAFDMTAWPGSTSFYLVDRDDPANNWTRTKSRRPLMHPIISEWTA
jgi:hypothetical protein